MAGGTLSSADAKAILQSTEGHIRSLFSRIQSGAGDADAALRNLATAANSAATTSSNAAAGMAAAAAAGHAFATIPQQVSTQIASEMRSSFSGTGGLIAGLAGDSLGNAAKLLSGQLGAAGGGLGLFNAGIGLAGGAMKGMTTTMSKAMPTGFGLQTMMKGVTGTLGALGTAAGMAVNFLNDNLKTWQNLSSTGIALGGDMSAISQMAAGTMLSFGQLSGHLTRNAEALAVFGGTADAGAKAFGMMMISMRDNVNTYADSSRSLMYVMDNLGITSDESAGLIGTMISDMAMASTYRNMGDTARQHATADYIVQLDQLAKMTGKSREELAKQQQQSSLNAQYQAALMDMDAEQALQAKAAMTEVQKEGPLAVNAMMAAIAGAPVLDDAGMLYATTEMATTVRALGESIRSGTVHEKSLDEFRTALVPAREATIGFIKEFVKMGPALGGDFAKMTAIWEGGLFAEFQKTEAIIQKYSQKLGISADKVNYLDALASSIDESRGVAKDAQGNIVSIASESTQAITRLNTTMNLLTSWLTGKAGEFLFAEGGVDSEGQPTVGTAAIINKTLDTIGNMAPALKAYKATGDDQGGPANNAQMAQALFDAMREGGGSATSKQVEEALRKKMSTAGFGGHTGGLGKGAQDEVLRGILEREGRTYAAMSGADVSHESGATITKAKHYEPKIRALQQELAKLGGGPASMGVRGEKLTAQIAALEKKSQGQLSLDDLKKSVLGLGKEAGETDKSMKQQALEDSAAPIVHALVGDRGGSLLDGITETWKAGLTGNETGSLLEGIGKAITTQTTSLATFIRSGVLPTGEDNGTSLAE